MNVLYLSYDGALDPLGRSQVVPYLEGLSASGHRFDLITFEKPTRWMEAERRREMADRLSEAGIEWHPLRYHKRLSMAATSLDLARARTLAGEIVKRRRIELVHARSYPPAVVARSVFYRTGVPYVFDMRGLYPEERVDGGLWSAGGSLFRVAKKAERVLLRDAAAVVTLTRASVPIVRSLMERAGSAASLDVVPTSVDLDRFRPGPERFGRPCIAYLGSLGTWYMLPEMLAFGRSAIEHAGVTLRLIVNDPGAQLRPMLAAAGIAPNDVDIRSVTYDQVPNSLADVSATFAFIRPAPSKVASAATKISESLALGLPVAVNDGVGDAADLAREEGVGVVVDPTDEASFPKRATSLRAMAEDGNVRARCRQVAEERFDLEGAVRRYDRLYAKSAKRGREK